MQIFASKIKKDSSLVRDFIPAKRTSDNAIGLYDLVSNSFFGNAGTGTFTAGSEIPQTIDGFLIKPIRDFGTWTVTATDGVHTKTQDILVDVITDYEIEMWYEPNYLLLYDHGDECEEMTGGWNLAASGTAVSVIKEDSKITISRNTDGKNTYLMTENGIDLTNYTKLCLNVVSKSGTIYFAVFPSHSISGPVILEQPSSVGVHEVDVSFLNKIMWVGLGCASGTTYSFDKVWLEE